MTIGFRRMTAADLRALHEWLQRKHVRRWWSKHETYEDVVQHYLPAIEGREPTDLYLIVLDGEPAGFIQTYRTADYPEYRDLVMVEEGVSGVDLFLADERLTGRGLGSEVLRQFVRDVVFADPATHACIADPDTDNLASIRAFQKAGFAPVRQFVDPSDGDRLHTLMRIDRYGERRSSVQPAPSRR
jgi:RimJ/RimL family protein N-acetyltransferase